MANDFQDYHLFDYPFPLNLCPELESGLPITDVDVFQGYPSCQSDGFNDFLPGTSPTYSGGPLYQDSLLESFSPTSSQLSPLSADFFSSPMSPDEYGNFTSPQSSVGALDVPDFSLFLAPLENSFDSVLNPHVHYSTPPPETKVAPTGGTASPTEHKLHNPPPRQRTRRPTISDARKRRDRLTKFRCEVCAEELYTKNRRQHMSTHDVNRQRFTCNHPGCGRSFTRVHDRNRHALKDHPTYTTTSTPTLSRRTTPTRCDACRQPINGEDTCPCGYYVTSLN